MPPFVWTDGFESALGHGTVGGVGFRETALPVVVHITDAVSHEGTDYAGSDIDYHTSTQAFDPIYMTKLYDLGFKLVNEPNPWQKVPPRWGH